MPAPGDITMYFAQRLFKKAGLDIISLDEIEKMLDPDSNGPSQMEEKHER